MYRTVHARVRAREARVDKFDCGNLKQTDPLTRAIDLLFEEYCTALGRPAVLY